MIHARVLIVEDESIVRMHLRHAMQTLGHDVVATVATANDAVEAARRECPDLILMDIQLGGDRSGIEAARELRRFTDAALVFVTAFADDNTVKATESVGAVGYIVKPFTEPELRAMVMTALATHQRTSRLRARERSMSRVLMGDAQALMVADTNGKVTFANRNAREALGWQAHEVLGRSVLDVLRIDPSSRPELERGMAKVLSGDDGEAFPFKVRAGAGGDALLGELAPLFPETPSEAALAVVFGTSNRTEAREDGHHNRGQRLLMYSHDTFGLGHLRRSINLTSALVRKFPHLSILIVTGSSVVHRFRLPERVDYVKLPAVRKVSSDRYRARSLVMSEATIAEFRANLLLRTVQDFDPDLVLVDHSPAGMNGELIPSLRWLRSSRPESVTMLGLRDVIDDPLAVVNTWTRDGTYDLVADNYDRVFVYGMQSVFDAAEAYRFPAPIASKVTYLNYVAESEEDRSAEEIRRIGGARPRVFVTIGGGDGAGELVIGTILDMADRLGTDVEFDTTIVTGPLINESLLRTLQERAARHPSVTLIEFVETTSKFMREADLVICTGGYNTTSQAMRYGQSVMIIPRITHRSEQLFRAEKLRARGMTDVIHPDELTAEGLASRIREALSRGSSAQISARKLLRFDGAERLAAYCAEHGLIGDESELKTHE